MRVHQFKPWRWLELDPCGVFMTYWIIIFLRAKMCLPQIWIFVCWSYEKCCRGDDPCNFSIRVCQIEIFASLLVPQVPFGSIGAKKSPPRCFQAQRSFRSMAFCSLLALLPFASAGGGPMACASRYLHGGLLKRLQSTSHLLSEMKMESKKNWWFGGDVLFQPGNFQDVGETQVRLVILSVLFEDDRGFTRSNLKQI